MTNKLPVVGKRYRATDSNKFIHNKNFVLTCDEVSDYMIILNKKEDASYIGWPAKDFFDDYEELPEDKAETKLDAITAKHWEEAGKDYFSSAKYSKIKQIRSEEVNKAWYDGYRTALQAQTKPETQSHFVDINKMELSPEVKEAMEELRKECSKPIKEKSFEPCNFKPITVIEEYFTLLNKVKIFFNALDKQFKVNKTSKSVDVKKEEVKEKFILDSIYYDKQGLPVSIYKKEEEIDRIKMEKLREYFKEKYKSYETQPDENGSFKHIDGAEEETQDLMKKDIFGSGKKQVESEKKIEEETYQTSSIEDRTSIWKDVSELPEKSCNVYLRWIDGDILPAEFIAAGFGRDAIFRNSNTEFPYKTTDSRIKEYCTLTDFINNIEERLRKLEGK